MATFEQGMRDGAARAIAILTSEAARGMERLAIELARSNMPAPDAIAMLDGLPRKAASGQVIDFARRKTQPRDS